MVKSFRKFLEFTENNPEEIRKALTSAGVHVRMQHGDLSSDERKRLVHDHLRSQGHHVTKDGRIALNPKWYDGKSHDKFKKKAIKRFGEGNDPELTSESVRDIFKATKLLAKFYQTRKDEDAFKAIKFGWSYIKNPKIRKAVVTLVKYIARMHGHRDWKGTVEYIKKNTGVDISDYEQDWKRVKGGYTFTTFVPEGNDPKVGTGKKPPGTDRRLYTDENPDDTVPIRFATVADAERTVAKVKKISKPFARQIQILNVGQQRAKVMGKKGVVSKFETGKNQIRSKEMAKRAKEK